LVVGSFFISNDCSEVAQSGVDQMCEIWSDLTTVVTKVSQYI